VSSLQLSKLAGVARIWMILAQSMLEVFRGVLKRSVGLIVFALGLQGTPKVQVSVAYPAGKCAWLRISLQLAERSGCVGRRLIRTPGLELNCGSAYQQIWQIEHAIPAGFDRLFID
jgi:hypothetical protein